MSNKPFALITGAASGLGLGMAHQLKHKYQLILVDINIDALDKTCSNIPDAHLFACDLSNGKDIDQLVGILLRDYHSLELLINNAGITHRSLAKITAPEVTEKVMAVDYFAPVRLTQGLLPLLEMAQGKVVNISSMAGWMPVMARAGYCAAKSALHQYFETFRAEMRPFGVKVLMVYPSFIDTPIENNALDGQGGKTRHARSMVGKMRSSEWMVERIVSAIYKDKERLFPDGFTFFSSIIYKLFPSLYMKLMSRKFASEWEVL